jgi:hypothetical protein
MTRLRGRGLFSASEKGSVTLENGVRESVNVKQKESLKENARRRGNDRGILIVIGTQLQGANLP